MLHVPSHHFQVLSLLRITCRNTSLISVLSGSMISNSACEKDHKFLIQLHASTVVLHLALCKSISFFTMYILTKNKCLDIVKTIS